MPTCILYCSCRHVFALYAQYEPQTLLPACFRVAPDAVAVSQATDFLLPRWRSDVEMWLGDFLLATLEQRLKDSVSEASERYLVLPSVLQPDICLRASRFGD